MAVNETIRWTDRDDTLLFVTSDGVISASKRQLGVDVTKGVLVDRFDVSSLPKNAVTVFLRYLVKHKPISEELSIKDVAALIHLAKFYALDDLLQQISECLIRVSTSNETALCLCYILACVCDLHMKTQLAKSIAIKFDETKAVLCEHVEESEILCPILERCDLIISEEKELIIFITSWTSLHKSTREECARLLNCTRKLLISATDLKSLSVHVRENATDSMNAAWEAYINNTSTVVCWHTKHIMEKWPRCGVRKHMGDCGAASCQKENSPTKSNRHQSKRVRFLLPADDVVVIEERGRTAPTERNRCNVKNSTGLPLQSVPSPQMPKNAFVRSLLKLRQKFTRKSTN